MQKGFGLVELLLVIAIIGILAGLILSASSRGRDKAFDSAIQNALRQIRWQAEIAFNTNNNSYADWKDVPVLQEELTILLEEIDKNYGDTDPLTYVTVLRDSQRNDFCASAPTRSDPNAYYCVDAGGKMGLTSAHCPDEPENGAPLKCQ